MLDRIFKLKENNTNVRIEVIAGLTTFMTMAYIIAVNPAILEKAGIPIGPSTTATILAAAFGTILMGFLARRPFAIAPYMGENAFVAITVVGILGYTWQNALAAILIGGILFILITLFRLRAWLAKAIPEGLKYSFAVGIGLFLTFIGLKVSGIIAIPALGMLQEGAKIENGLIAAVRDAPPVKVGDFGQPEVWISIFTFILMGILIVKKVKGALLLSIIVSTILCIVKGVAESPERLMSMPPPISEIFCSWDFSKVFTLGFFPIILVVFIMDFVDTMGTLIGVSARANLLDEKGNLPEIEKPMLCDALATVFGAMVGTTTTGTYIESAAGIEEGGRTGLTSVVTAILFLAALFFAPFFMAIPPQAYGPALIIVGLLMLSPITKINFKDYTEAIPAFSVVVLMSFTYNIGVGMTAGFVLYPFFKLISGRWREIHPGLVVLGILSLLFYIFYPYS